LIDEKTKVYIYKLVDEVVNKYKNEILSVVIFGAESKGVVFPESDIDILVVVRNYNVYMEDAIKDKAFEMSLKINRKIDLDILDDDDFRFMVSNYLPFLLETSVYYEILYDPFNEFENALKISKIKKIEQGKQKKKKMYG